MDIQAIASGSTGNCYMVFDGHTRIMIEAGIPMAMVQKKYGYILSSCSACLISHYHGDHAKYASSVMRKGIDVYASQETLDACDIFGHRTHALKNKEQFTVGTWAIMGFDVDHDAKGSMGFLLASRITKEKLLYFTDTPHLNYRFCNVTHIMAECNYDNQTLHTAVSTGKTPLEAANRIYQTHMGLEDLLETLKANDLANLRKVYLMHLSDRHADERLIKRNVQKATGAEVEVC